MKKFIAILLVMQLTGCISTATIKDQPVRSDISVVDFKDDEISGQSNLYIFEAQYSGGDHDGKLGLQLGRGEDQITILPNNLENLELDLKTVLNKTEATGIVIPSFDSIKKGYIVEMFYAEGKRIISIKNGGAYLTLDVNNVKKLIQVIDQTIDKNASASVVAS